MAHMVRTHWTGTSCLCSCHYSSRTCDDKVCGKPERGAIVAAPVTAAAAQPYVERFTTPLGFTSRFSR